jgi:hypothetical protein
LTSAVLIFSISLLEHVDRALLGGLEDHQDFLARPVEAIWLKRRRA